MVDTPNEDDITKQQLWERDLSFRKANAAEVKGVNSSLAQFEARMESVITKHLDGVQKASQADIAKATKAVEEQARSNSARHDAACKKLETQNTALAQFIDKSLSDGRKAATEQIKKEVDSSLSEFKRAITSVEKKFKKLEKDISDGNTLYQASITPRLSEALAGIEELRQRLNKMLGELRL
jgi:uncharacterized protein YicC (UPF0701 family)